MRELRNASALGIERKTYVDPDGKKVILASGSRLIEDGFKGNFNPDGVYVLRSHPVDNLMLGAVLNFIGVYNNNPTLIGELRYDQDGTYCTEFGWDRIRIKKLETCSDMGGFYSLVDHDNEVEFWFNSGNVLLNAAGDISKIRAVGKVVEKGGNMLDILSSLKPTPTDIVQNAALAKKSSPLKDIATSLIPGYSTIKSLDELLHGGNPIEDKTLLNKVK